MTPPFPRLGAGVGLRPKHYAAALADGAALPAWFEVVSENFFVAGGRPIEVLAEAARRRPVALHGVSLSIGGEDPLDERYLDRLAALAERVRAPLVSDHLCWSAHGGRHSHDLLPLCFTPAEARRIASRVKRVQDRLGRRILLENVSSYLAWKASEMPEWAFLGAIAEAADCGILLDVNNVFVNAANHGFDAVAYLAGLPVARVGQIHLAGHSDRGRYLFDTHDAPVPEPVWALYERALARFGPVATLVEWDDKLPTWEALLAEASRAQSLLAHTSEPEDERGGSLGLAAPVNAAESVAVVGSVTVAGTADAAKTPMAPDHVAAHETGAAPVDGAHGALWRALAGGDPEIAAPLVTESPPLSPAERVRVYTDAYAARLHDALLEDFRATDALLGHTRFHTLASDYVHAHPSTSPSLRDLGRGFAAFVRAREGDAAGDLAALEWARVEAFDAADAPVLGAPDLATVPPDRWPRLTFVPHPSLRIVETRFRVDEPWRTADAGDESVAAPEPATAGGALRVWREGTTVYHAWMEPPEASALRALAAAEPFARAGDRLLAALPAPDADAAAARLSTLLRDWIADGLFTAADAAAP